MPTAGKLETMEDGVLVNSLRKNYSNHFATAEILVTMEDGVSLKSSRQSLQQSFANTRYTRYNAGWCFSQFIKLNLTAIISQQQK